MDASWFAQSLSALDDEDDEDRYRQLVRAALDRLLADGFMVASPYRLTNAGQERVREVFHGRLPPEGTTWSTIVQCWLPAAALGLPHDADVLRRMSTADGFRATVIAREAGTTVGVTERQVLDQLVWRLLGESTDRPLSVGALHRWALRRALGRDEGGSTERLSTQYTAHLLGVEGDDLHQVRRRLARRFLEPEVGPSAPQPKSSPPSPASRAPADSPPLKGFADLVRRAAASPFVQRFGPDQAFIASVFEVLPEESDLDRFKSKLTRAHSTGALRLSTSSLVHSMDPLLVQSSRTLDRGREFHFVDIEV
jgi:hypothetical protein